MSVVSGSVNAVAGRAAVLGAATGLRSQLPLTLLAVAAQRGGFAATTGSPLGLLRSRYALVGLGLLTAGELVGDKLPRTPSRLAPGPLTGRLLFGALVGAAVAREAGYLAAAGAVIGAAGAGAGAFAGYRARTSLGRATAIADPVWGVVEDLVALSLGALALRDRLGR